MVENEEPGVYLIHGIVSIPLRIVVIRELEDDKLSAMKIMKRNAKPLDIEKFLQEAKDYEDLEDKRSADAVLQVSANVNKELYERLRGDEKMCEALKEIMAEDIKDAEKQIAEKINRLNVILIQTGRNEDVVLAANDAKYQAQLIRELVDPNYKG